VLTKNPASFRARSIRIVRWALIVTVSVVMAAGCGSHPRGYSDVAALNSKIKTGMSITQVEGIAGKPNFKNSIDSQTLWSYIDKHGDMSLDVYFHDEVVSKTEVQPMKH
jgi:hypothetical protein